MHFKTKFVCFFAAVQLLILFSCNVANGSSANIDKIIYQTLSPYEILETNDYSKISVASVKENHYLNTSVYTVVYDDIWSMNFTITTDENGNVNTEYVEKFLEDIQTMKVFPITKNQAIEIAESYFAEYLESSMGSALYQQFLSHFAISQLTTDDIYWQVRFNSYSIGQELQGEWAIIACPMIANLQIGILPNHHPQLIRWQTIYVNAKTGDMLPLNDGMSDYNFTYMDNYLDIKTIEELYQVLNTPSTEQFSSGLIQAYVEEGWPLQYWTTDVSHAEVVWISCSRTISWYNQYDAFSRYARMLSPVYQCLFQNDDAMKYGAQHQPGIYSTVISLYEANKENMVIR